MSETELKLEKLKTLLAKLADEIAEAGKILRGEKTSE